MKILLYLCFLVQTSAGKNKKLKNEVLDKSEESDFSETFIGDGQDGEIKGNQALNLPDDDFDTEVTVVKNVSELQGAKKHHFMPPQPILIVRVRLLYFSQKLKFHFYSNFT